MIIYKDILTGDELISDTYDLKESEKYPGFWEADLTKVTVGGEDFVLEGANASAEGEDAEDLENTSEQVLNIVRDFQLKEFPKPADKKSAQTDYKKYCKAVVTKLKEDGKAEQAEAFQGKAAAGLKSVFADWKDFDTYVGSSEESDSGMWVLVNYREDGITPYALVWKHALKEEKV